MPLNVRSLGAVVLMVFSGFVGLLAQTPSTTSGDVMRERITKAKAFIAVKNINAAIYELEGIRRETNDATVQSVANVILMNCYLEQGDYKRAQSFLTELYNNQKTNKPNAAQNYFAVAAQVVKGARTQFERYKSLGLSFNDKSLPSDAVNDIEKMRETVEKVIEQSKVISADKAKAATALALIEESSNARIVLARDDFDAKRWREEIADARDGLMNSRSTIVNAVDDDVAATTTNPPYVNTTPTVAVKNESQPIVVQNPPPPVPKIEESKPVETVKEAPKQTAPIVAKDEPKEEKQPLPNPNGRDRLVVGAPTQTVAPEAMTNADGTPMQVGSLVEFATQKVSPVYPPQARTMRMSGIVKIEVTVDEEGKVAAMQNITGPSMLQRAATEALKRWKFKPFTKDGQPVKANGFVNFNFNL